MTEVVAKGTKTSLLQFVIKELEAKDPALLRWTDHLDGLQAALSGESRLLVLLFVMIG